MFSLLCVNMLLDEKFKAACEELKKFTKKPPDSELLDVYALYKQATLGDINILKPSDVKGKAKWEAWNGKKGLSSAAAKEQYVDGVKALAPTYG